MSRLTRLTTTRLRNRLRRPWAIRPSTDASRALSRYRLGAGGRPVPGLGVEDRLHALLLAPLDDAAVLGEEDRDPLAGHHVVVAPHPRVADQHHPLLGVVVLGALRGPAAAVAGDDAHVAGGDGAHDAVALVVEVDLHPVGPLGGAVLGGHHVAGEHHQAFLLDVLELVRVDGDRRVAAVGGPVRARRGRGRRGARRARPRGRGLGPRPSGHAHRGPDGERGDHAPSGHEPPLGTGLPGTPVPFLNVARTRLLMLLTSSATFDSKPVPYTTAPER